MLEKQIVQTGLNHSAVITSSSWLLLLLVYPDALKGLLPVLHVVSALDAQNLSQSAPQKMSCSHLVSTKWFLSIIHLVTSKEKRYHTRERGILSYSAKPFEEGEKKTCSADQSDNNFDWKYNVTEK